MTASKAISASRKPRHFHLSATDHDKRKLTKKNIYQIHKKIYKNKCKMRLELLKTYCNNILVDFFFVFISACASLSKQNTCHLLVHYL